MSSIPFQTVTPPPALTPLRRATRFRIGLTAGLWCVVAAPLYVMATTAANFDGIFREFGLRMSPFQQFLLGLGRVLGTPVGIAFILLLAPLACYALVLLGLPRDAVSPADDPAGTRRHPRWERLLLVTVPATVVSVIITVVYLGSMLAPLQTITNTLGQTPSVGTAR
ncbi:MAG TPA: hypothetical protein VEB22_08830 [Phycisphaerales bacterium]|nr:hypothetical protein [Phycisphaerales bacterium]